MQVSRLFKKVSFDICNLITGEKETVVDFESFKEKLEEILSIDDDCEISISSDFEIPLEFEVIRENGRYFIKINSVDHIPEKEIRNNLGLIRELNNIIKDIDQNKKIRE